LFERSDEPPMTRVAAPRSPCRWPR
jgi:hypothetical protein